MQRRLRTTNACQAAIVRYRPGPAAQLRSGSLVQICNTRGNRRHLSDDARIRTARDLLCQQLNEGRTVKGTVHYTGDIKLRRNADLMSV
jgi:hypothetical protein